MYVTKIPLLMVCSGTVFRTKGRSVKAAAITDDWRAVRHGEWERPRGARVPSGSPQAATGHRRDRQEAANNVAASGSPTERRTEIAVEQQPNKRPSVGPSVLATKPEQNAILFRAAVGVSRGSVSLLPGTGSRNGAS